MRLLIVSHTPHYIRSGQIVGWEPTVREINHLALLFDEIRHIGWLHDESPPSAVIPYSTNRISFIPVKPSGGSGLKKKLSILTVAPKYLSVIRKNLKWADIVHVRCPSNISLMTVLLLSMIRHPKLRWVKYATNWSPTNKEPWSFSFQRWLLKKGLHHGIVTVNGNWPGQPAHIYSFLNPCVLDEELTQAKVHAYEKQFQPPIRFLHVGHLVERKGVGRALEILSNLRLKGISLRFDVVGEGERARFEQKTKELGLQDVVRFHGGLKRSDLNSLYLQAHFLLFPSSSSEGWPKVLSEAMAYGVVPIAGAISSIPQVLTESETGIALPLNNLENFVNQIADYVENPERWYRESKNAISSVENFTYTSYLSRLDSMFQKSWGIHPSPEAKMRIQSECS